jgi:hypothetical protein
MARTPTSTNDTQGPPDLLNMTNDNNRTGPPPPMNPFDSIMGYPPSTGPSHDSRYPFTQDISGIAPYPSTDSRPSSISSLDPYSDLSTIPESTARTRPRLDPPTEDPRLIENGDIDVRPTPSASMGSDAMPSLVHDRPLTPSVADHPMTFSDQMAALDLSSKDGPHRPHPDPWVLEPPTTPLRPHY